MANSSMWVLPKRAAPALRRRSITVASKAGMKPPKVLEPQVVGCPARQITSLIAMGRPARGPGSSPLEKAASMARASERAASRSTQRNANTLGSTASIRARQARVASSAEISRERIRESCSLPVRRKSSRMALGAPLPRGELLADNLRDAEVPVFCFRGVGQSPQDLEGRSNTVLAEGLILLGHVGSGLDSLGVELVELVDVNQDGIELPGEDPQLFFGELQVGQAGYVAHRFELDAHGMLLLPVIFPDPRGPKHRGWKERIQGSPGAS